MRADNEVYLEAARRPGRWEPDGGTRLLAYLVGSAVNGMVPDEESVARIDLDEPVRVASHHMLTVTIAPAPEVAGTDDGRFARALRPCIEHGGGSV